MAKQNPTAKGGREAQHPESHSEQVTLQQVLEHIQHFGMRIPEIDSVQYLIIEPWDWLVVLQCMQDNDLFTIHPQRMPLTEFTTWLRIHNVPQMLAKCTKRTMSYANDAINGARYPWDDVEWNPYVLERWRILYRTLDNMLQNMSNVPK